MRSLILATTALAGLLATPALAQGSIQSQPLPPSQAADPYATDAEADVDLPASQADIDAEIAAANAQAGRPQQAMPRRTDADDYATPELYEDARRARGDQDSERDDAYADRRDDDRHYRDPRDERMARGMPSPGEARAAGRAMGRAAEAMMDIDVGPVIDAVDPYRRHSHGGRRTIGDLASRGDPYARERIARDMDRASDEMGRMAYSARAMTPVLRRTMEEIERSVEAAIRAYPRSRYDYDPRYDD